MEFGVIVTIIKEVLVPLLIFIALLALAIIRGRRVLTSLILGLYLALLISFVFPYEELVFSYIADDFLSDNTVAVILFAIYTVLSSFFFDRILFYRDDETAFSGLGKKMVLALLATILIIAFSHHIFEVPRLVDSGAFINGLFAPRESFFWWFMVPLISLFILY